jgi:hypothetical protein
MHKFTSTMTALALLALAGSAQAKLPVASDEAKATAAAAKDKAAWSDKVMAYQVCRAQDKVAAHYFATKAGASKPAADLPACTDPGPYIAALGTAQQVGVADSKPVPAAGKPEPAKK